MKVLIPDNLHEKSIRFLESRGYEVVTGHAKDEEGLIREVGDADGLLARSYPFTARVIDAAKKLKVIGRIGVGVDMIDVKHAEEKGIWVGVARGANTNAVAEHTMSLIAACAKNIVLCDSETKAGNYDIRNKVQAVELRGKTLGVIGLGAIGRTVAEIAHNGFGMEVAGYDMFLSPAIPDYVRILPSAEDVLKEADVVTLHVPATPETENMIRRETLQLMKPSAILVNCARGALVNEADLAEALRDGVILAAGTDVFTNDIPSADNPLLTAVNMTVSPHYASFTAESNEMMEMMAAEAVDAVLKGGAPKFPVNSPKL